MLRPILTRTFAGLGVALLLIGACSGTAKHSPSSRDQREAMEALLHEKKAIESAMQSGNFSVDVCQAVGERALRWNSAVQGLLPRLPSESAYSRAGQIESAYREWAREFTMAVFACANGEHDQMRTHFKASDRALRRYSVLLAEER